MNTNQARVGCRARERVDRQTVAEKGQGQGRDTWLIGGQRKNTDGTCVWKSHSTF